MPGMVSVRIGKLKNSGGQEKHDFREGYLPDYVDKEKTGDNVVLVDDRQLPERSGDMEKRYRESHDGRNMRRDANSFLSGIITFSEAARDQVNQLPPDAQAQELVTKIAEKYQTDVCYIVCHKDESTVHYHFMLEGYDKNGFSVSEKLDRTALKQVQDLAGEVFREVGIERGVSKVERIQRGEDFSKTVHRSVNELHKDLPLELEKKHKELNVLKVRIEKNQKLADEKRADIEKLKQTEGFQTEKLEKLQKTLNTYEKRIEKLQEIEREQTKEIESVAARVSRSAPSLTTKHMPGLLDSKEQVVNDLNLKLEERWRPILADNERLRQTNRHLELQSAQSRLIPGLEQDIKELRQENKEIRQENKEIKTQLKEIYDFLKSRGEQTFNNFLKSFEKFNKEQAEKSVDRAR